MGNLYNHAKRELDLILNSIDRGNDADSYEMQKEVNDEILELVKLFESQGDSGCSASYKISKLEKLLRFKTITPLTGEDSEWMDGHIDDNTQQNIRCTSVFRDNHDNSTARDIDGCLISDNGGISWFYSGSIAKKLGYDNSVKFPYDTNKTVKKFYIRYKDIKKHDEFDDITGDETAIKELQEDYKRHSEDWRW